MNGEGKKHTLRFDPRTELLLLVLANIVAFTQHSVWVEITWVIFLLLPRLVILNAKEQTPRRTTGASSIAFIFLYHKNRKMQEKRG